MRRLLLACLLAFAACEERGRTKNSGGGATLDDEQSAAVNVYRFVDGEKALADARKAVAEERWADASLAAAALLKRQPDHAEGQKLAGQAAFEGANQAAFLELRRGLEQKSPVTVGASYHRIAAGSRYLELARADYERVREQWAEQRETDARNLVKAGRCRDAHRVARSADESFPEMRPRLDVVADNCRPASGQDEPEPEPRPPVAEIKPAPPVASPPIATLDPFPTAPVPAPAPVPVPVPEPVPPPPPVVVTPPVVVPPAAPQKPRVVAAVELESYRISGDKRPPLPAGARMIASRDKVKTIMVGIGFCLSPEGIPSSVDLIKPCEYSDANEKIVSDVKTWRFRPYTVAGQAVVVCTRMAFVYQME